MEGTATALATLLAAIEGAGREAMLFAAIGFLIGGIDDVLVDISWLFLRFRRDSPNMAGAAAPAPAPVNDGPFIIFVPAWDEGVVIGRMIAATLARYGRSEPGVDFRLMVGAYPNDPATIAAVQQAAMADGRVQLVIGPLPGPTTKADCLNVLWRALIAQEASQGWQARAIVLHDAEDVVDPQELSVIARHLVQHDVVQLPVMPLVVPGSPLVSGHYADEFAHAHGVQLVLRQALGAALPLAGVGCGIDRVMLGRIAQTSPTGLPFDADSLTEDYELGLRIAALGGSAWFARDHVPCDDPSGWRLVAVRAHFPAGIAAAVRQKARWMTGIALAGWDRTGWSRARHWQDHWMRMRDRRGPLAIIVLAAAYLALICWALAGVIHAASGIPEQGIAVAVPDWLLTANIALLLWRLAMRMACTARQYGWRQGLLALPRAFVGNVIALLAARRALARYIGMLRGARPVWDKTVHSFPDLSMQEGRVR